MHPIKEFRPATEQERMYCYAQSHEIQMKTGMIGYLRGDFGTNGGLFYTTWFDAPGGEKTQAFKDEFDDLVNALRSDPEFLGVLKSRTAMSAYCHTVPESEMEGNYTTEYAFRADTDTYAVIMRLNPTKGDYNFSLHCFEKSSLDRHLVQSAKGIRFITPDYAEKFRIRTKDTAQNLMDDGQVTPEEYAADQMKYAAEDVTDTAGNTIKSGADKAKEKAKDAMREHRQEKRELQERMEQEPDTTHREPAQRQSGAASNSGHRAAETARSPQEAGRQSAKKRFRDEKRNRPLRRERTVRTLEQQKQTIKQSARSAGKQTIKTKEAVRGTGKAVKETGKGNSPIPPVRKRVTPWASIRQQSSSRSDVPTSIKTIR